MKRSQSTWRDGNQRPPQSAWVNHYHYGVRKGCYHTAAGDHQGSCGPQASGTGGEGGGRSWRNNCHLRKLVDLWTPHGVYILTTRELVEMEGEKGMMHKLAKQIRAKWEAVWQWLACSSGQRHHFSVHRDEKVGEGQNKMFRICFNQEFRAG